MFSSCQEALKFIKDKQIEMVDLKVAGIAGQWLHLTIPAQRFCQGHFDEGVGYDGSSGSGFARVESGDVSAKPEPETGFIDPFWERPTISFICSTVEADSKAPFPNDPRSIAKRAVAYMRIQGIADEALMAPEFEFHVFDRVDVFSDTFESHVSIHCNEVHPDGTSTAIPHKRGYLRTPPSEQLHDLRSEVALILQDMGVPIRYHHHEVGAPGQCELETSLAPMLKAGDYAMLIKYVIKNVARRRGKIATFMPKPLYGEAGNGMHVHQRLEKAGKPLFYSDEPGSYANLSDTALYYVAGLLTHGQALAGLTNPSTNSYKRLVEGYEAPVNLFFSLGNRSAAIRVPRYAVTPEQKRIEYRPPDFTGNVYMTLAAMLMAGLDGIRRKLEPSEHGFGPYDVDIAKESEAFKKKIAGLPRNLYDALEALRNDHAFLTQGEVTPQGFVDTWIENKLLLEHEEVSRRPHPYEYQLYLDA